jgi:hypothetical protein
VIEPIAVSLMVRRVLRETEVQNLHDAVSREKEILRLEIAVNDPFLVRRRQAGCDLPRLGDRLRR